MGKSSLDGSGWPGSDRAALSESAPPGLPVAVGDVFPHLNLPTIDGSEQVFFSGVRDSHLLLHFFASW